MFVGSFEPQRSSWSAYLYTKYVSNTDFFNDPFVLEIPASEGPLWPTVGGNCMMNVVNSNTFCLLFQMRFCPRRMSFAAPASPQVTGVSRRSFSTQCWSMKPHRLPNRNASFRSLSVASRSFWSATIANWARWSRPPKLPKPDSLVVYSNGWYCWECGQIVFR